MAENTKIEWADHSWSPWHGCAKVSPGCAHCYAERQSKRNPGTLGVWGPDGTRVLSKDWEKPVRWNRAAQAAGERQSVFPSICDPFEDRPDLVAWRQRFFHLVGCTPWLTWLLLTKRPENVERMGVEQGLWCPQDGLPRNVWLGTSVEDQQRADERIPLLLQTPAAVRFLSCEPLLGPVDLRRWFDPKRGISGEVEGGGFMVAPRLKYARPLHWVIVGGESGPGARPCDVAWVRSIVAQCRAAGVPCFVKQLGRNVRWSPAFGAAGQWPAHVRFDYERRGEASEHRIVLRHDKGGDMEEWPGDLRVREFPAVEARTS